MLQGEICSSEFKANPFTIICYGFATSKIYWSNLEFLRRDNFQVSQETQQRSEL